VGDDHDRTAKVADQFLEPQDAVEVEVVGRLVEQQQVGLGDQRARQRHALDPAARQAGNLRRRVESETRDDLLDALVEAPAIGGLDRVLQVSSRASASGLACSDDHQHGGVVIDQQLRGGAQAVGDGGEDVALEVEIGLLRHVGGDHFGLPPHCAIIERRLAGERPQQAGLARAVAPDEGDALARRRAGSSLVEQVDVTEGEAGVIYGKQGHGVGARRAAAGRIGVAILAPRWRLGRNPA
jgi:hypothetical protein